MAGEARPIKLVDPFITLSTEGTTPVTVDLKCFAKGVHLMGEEDDALATFCDPLGYSWTLNLDLLMSLGATGVDEALESLGGPGTVVDFEFAYTPDPASVDNPHWTGKCRLVAWPIVDAGINEPTEFTIEMDVIGDITKDVGGAGGLGWSFKRCRMITFDDLTLAEVEEITATALGGKSFGDASADPMMMAGAVLWMAKRREDPSLAWEDFKRTVSMRDIKAFSQEMADIEANPLAATNGSKS